MSLPTPNTRKEQFLNAIATGNAGGLPTPITREEEYLEAIAKSGGGSGDGDMKKSVYDSDLDVAGAGGIKAFVNDAISGKVDKVVGKGLSENDYTDEDKAIVDGVTGALAGKADTEDIPDLVSDNLAKGILGNETVLSTDNVPFVSKIMSSGKYQRKKFIGCSYVWNQIVVANAKTATYTCTGETGNYNQIAYILSSAEIFTLQAGHKYFSSIYIERTISGNDYVGVNIGSSGYIISTGKLQNGTPNGRAYNIFTPTNTFSVEAVTINNYNGKRGFTQGDTVSFDNLFIVDLTKLFGSTAIADYIYNLEQATAGAGIAKLKELGFFTEDYYAYDAGSIQSVDIKGYSVVDGFNLWDEQWELGYYGTSSGEPRTATTEIRSKNPIPVEPNTTYYYRRSIAGGDVIYFDKNKDYISSTTNAGNKTFRTPANCYFIKLNMGNTYGTTYSNDICINLSDPARNGQYEPYHKTTYQLTPTELRGVPKIDANNNIYADGDEYASDGEVARKYVIADIGTLDLSKHSASTSTMAVFRAAIPDIKPVKNSTTTPKLVCADFIGQACNATWAPGRMTFASYQGAPLKAIYFITDPSYTLETFKAAMSGHYLIYEKATPTTETLTPFDYPQSVGSLEEIVDYKVEQEDRDVAIPTGHVTEYMGKGGEFTLPTLPTTPSVLAFDGHNFFWKPETA